MSDLVGRKVYRISLNGAVEAVIDVPGCPPGLGFLPGGTPLVVSMCDRRLFRIEDGKPALHADLSALVGAELNDMVLDEQGRVYVGSYGFEIPASSRCCNACLVLVDATGTASIVATGLELPNRGIITANRLLLAETFVVASQLSTSWTTAGSMNGRYSPILAKFVRTAFARTRTATFGLRRPSGGNSSVSSTAERSRIASTHEVGRPWHASSAGRTDEPCSA